MIFAKSFKLTTKPVFALTSPLTVTNNSKLWPCQFFVGTFSKNFNIFLLIPIVVPEHVSGVKSFSSSNINHIFLLNSANIRPFTQRNWYLCTMNVLVVTATKEELSIIRLSIIIL